MTVATFAGGRYRVDRVLGSGGMAIVYRAHDDELHREVAVKLLAEHLAEDPDFHARFLREAKVAAQLSHPNVVAVFDAGEDEGRPFIVMELVHGETLAAVLARRGSLPVGEVVDLGSQAAAGLEHAHAHGLVHRDVKPHNLLLREDGMLKIADFGIARAATATHRLTQVGTVLGTAAYLAPEQAVGEDVSPAADLYSLGAVLYELLTGRPPFQADTLVQLVVAQQQGTVTPVTELRPDVPPALEDVVMRCLARNPAYRPASAAALARLLSESLPGPATRPLPAENRLRKRRDGDVHLHHSARWAGLAAVLAALGILGGVLVATGGDSSTPAPPPERPGKPALQARELAAWLREAGG